MMSRMLLKRYFLFFLKEYIMGVCQGKAGEHVQVQGEVQMEDFSLKRAVDKCAAV